MDGTGLDPVTQRPCIAIPGKPSDGLEPSTLAMNVRRGATRASDTVVAAAAMNQEIQLISDGDGLAVIGDSTAVERFLATEELPSEKLELHRIKGALSTGAAASQVGSEIAANSGRWVKLTAESAQKVKKYGLTPTKTPGVDHAMIGKPGEIKSWLQITTKP